MRPTTRRERRAERQRRRAAARRVAPAPRERETPEETRAARPWDGDTPLPWWLRPLDYKVSGETGALRVRSKVRTWHLGGRANGHRPPPGQGWERSGPAYLVETGGTRLEKPVEYNRRPAPGAEQTAVITADRRRRPGHNRVWEGVTEYDRRLSAQRTQE